MRSILGTILAAAVLAPSVASGSVECSGSVNVVDYSTESGGNDALSGPRYGPPACTIDLAPGLRSIAIRWGQAATGVARVEVVAVDETVLTAVCSVEAGIPAACNANADYPMTMEPSITGFDVSFELPADARASFSVGAPVYGTCEGNTACLMLWIASGEFTARFS